MARGIDLTGRRFGRLVARELLSTRSNGRLRWRCQCDCGQSTEVRSSHLISGVISSCGCLNREATSRANRTHGQSRSRVYAVWRQMCQRCTNPMSERYPDYGARGITACDAWLGFGGYERFIADMGQPPNDDYTIERRNNARGYEPENCEWIPAPAQALNKRNNRIIEYYGVSKPLAVWARDIGVPYKRLHHRISRGWSIERAFSTSTGISKD